MIFKISIKVQGFHLDVYQHVNNARYLEFLETGRWDLMDKTGLLKLLGDSQLAFVIVNININYRAPAQLFDELEIHTAIQATQERKGIISQRVINKKSGKLVAEASVTYVVVNRGTGKTERLSEELIKEFSKFIEPQPQ